MTNVVPRERDGHRRVPQKAPLHGGGHRSRIKYVIAEIGAGVDSGDDHVRLVIQQSGQGQMHAIRGRAGHVQKTVGGAVDAQGAVQRKRIAGAAAVAVRRDHHHGTVAGQGLGQTHDTWRLVAVIVAD